jgi:hypothetical protein
LVGDKVYGLPEDEVLTLLDGHREDLRSEVSPDPVDSPEELVPSRWDDEEGPSEEESEIFQIPGPVATTYAEIEAKLLIPRHALHAAGLRFRHPTSGELLTFESDLPADLKGFFEGLTGVPLRPFRTSHW